MANFSKVKVGGSTYDVKDAGAGRSLSYDDQKLYLENAAGDAISEVTLPPTFVSRALPVVSIAFVYDFVNNELVWKYGDAPKQINFSNNYYVFLGRNASINPIRSKGKKKISTIHTGDPFADGAYKFLPMEYLPNQHTFAQVGPAYFTYIVGEAGGNTQEWSIHVYKTQISDLGENLWQYARPVQTLAVQYTNEEDGVVYDNADFYYRTQFSQGTATLGASGYSNRVMLRYSEAVQTSSHTFVPSQNGITINTESAATTPLNSDAINIVSKDLTISMSTNNIIVPSKIGINLTH